jgi:hypothetical protein
MHQNQRLSAWRTARRRTHSRRFLVRSNQYKTWRLALPEDAKNSEPLLYSGVDVYHIKEGWLHETLLPYEYVLTRSAYDAFTRADGLERRNPLLEIRCSKRSRR